jgi:hypothetical protein
MESQAFRGAAPRLARTLRIGRVCTRGERPVNSTRPEMAFLREPPPRLMMPTHHRRLMRGGRQCVRRPTTSVSGRPL